jgi:hypothetical protein
MTEDQFREIALEMDGAIEAAHMGHPDFRANGRIFATLHANDRTGMVSLTPEEQQALMREHPRMFEPSPGAWGRQGATTVILAEADPRTLRQAMLLAWERVTQLPPRRPSRKKPSAPRVKKSSPARPRSSRKR